MTIEGQQRKPATILLVEDDPADREITRRAIECQSLPVDLRVAEDGEEALHYLTRTGRFSDPASSPAPDLVLLDLNLPKIDGAGVLRRMRADAELRSIPVVALTTSSQVEDIALSYALGANSFVTKPADFRAFAAMVRSLGGYWFDVVELPTPGGLDAHPHPHDPRH